MPKLKRIIFSLLGGTALFLGVLALLRIAGKSESKLVNEHGVRHQNAAADLGVLSSAPSSSVVNQPQPTLLEADIEMDSPDASHPVELALANGIILDSRILRTEVANHWIRMRLAKTEVQPQLVRVVELWKFDPVTRKTTSLSREMFLADQLILKVAPGITEAQLRISLATLGMFLESSIADGVFAVRLKEASLDAVPQALKTLAKHPELVGSAEPDGVGFGGGTPNDALFSQQWGLHNTGQNSGTIDADVDAPEFWDIIESASGIVIAVLDSGLNSAHPDLQGISWIIPSEVSGDGKDNDLSGKVDDTNGWDFVNNDNNPTDDHGHGSNVTGIIAANRNNSVGIAGMLSGVRILVCKIINSSNSGLTSDLIAAVTYARKLGVTIMNLSLQNYPYSSTLNTEFTACESVGILLCICAGNQGANNDITPNYPSSYPQSNIISVGNHDRTDVRWSGSFNPSNYGLLSVDLFAPGRDILSPVLGTSYSSYTGTSQATPYVTAVCAAIKYSNPSWKAIELKQSVLSSVFTRSSYNGVCVSGGRLNAVNAVVNAFRQLPSQDSDSDGFSNLYEYLAGTRADTVSYKPALVTEISGGFLRHGVPRVVRPDAHFEIEMSTDLINWTTKGITYFSTPSTLLGGLPLSDQSRAFMRIRAIPLPEP
jgi:subtilisin family serine protease